MVLTGRVRGGGEWSGRLGPEWDSWSGRGELVRMVRGRRAGQGRQSRAEDRNYSKFRASNRYKALTLDSG